MRLTRKSENDAFQVPDPLAGGGPGDAGLLELRFHVSRADAQLEAVVGEDLEREDVPGQQFRVVEGRVEHERAHLNRGGHLGGHQP